MDFPQCAAIISTSECLNYVSDQNNQAGLQQLFKKVFNALEDGGIFIFDMIEHAKHKDTKYIFEHSDWTIFSHTFEDEQNGILTRDITTFRKVGDLYRKSKELHKAKLYSHDDIALWLRSVGFNVTLFKNYDDLKLDQYHLDFYVKNEQ